MNKLGMRERERERLDGGRGSEAVGLDVVAFAYNPCYLEGEGRRINSLRLAGQKYETLS
jgi:hypothetical protein